MKVSSLDKKLAPCPDFSEKGLVWINVREAPFVISGVFFDESKGCYLRMDHEVADSVKSDVVYLNRNTAGGRVRFRTDSKFIAMYAVLSDSDEEEFKIMARSGFDLCRRDQSTGEILYAYSFAPPERMKKGFSGGYCAEFEGMQDYILHMPRADGVIELYVGLEADSRVEAPTPYKYEKPVVFYGSSITQGSITSRPANIYEAIISKRLDCEFLDLGFAGNARGETQIAEYIAGLDMSAFVLDYDHNAPDADHLRATHGKFFEIIRKAHPTLPIVIVSAPNIMPWYTWHVERREVIRGTYEAALAAGDENVYFVDGETIFDGVDRDLCTVDTCHPNDLGMYCMANKIGAALKEALEK